MPSRKKHSDRACPFRSGGEDMPSEVEKIMEWLGDDATVQEAWEYIRLMDYYEQVLV